MNACFDIKKIFAWQPSVKRLLETQFRRIRNSFFRLQS